MNKKVIIIVACVVAIVAIGAAVTLKGGIKTEDEEMAKRLYSYKTEDINDTTNIQEIIETLPFTDEYFEYQGIEFNTANEPYEVVVKERIKDGYYISSIDPDDVRSFADTVFALVNGLDVVKFEVTYKGESGGDEVSYYSYFPNTFPEISYDDSKEDFISKFRAMYIRLVSPTINVVS